MKRIFWVLVVTAMVAGVAHAEWINHLGGGALITHHVAELTYTEDPGTMAEDYETYALASAAEQDTRIDANSGYSAWFVLAAWTEDKNFCGVQFGLGDYDPAAYSLAFWGILSPPGATEPPLEITGGGWPDPNSGNAIVAAGDSRWTGSIVPIYYFGGYAYAGETQIELGVNTTVAEPFGGMVNCEQPVKNWSAVAFGAMGINTDGVAADPVEEVVRACCTPSGSCVGATEDECLALEGEWLADVNSCEPDPCLEQTAVCCDGAACFIYTMDQCEAAEGIWRGDWTSCDPNPCEQLHVCCLDENECELLTEDECATLAGDWMPEEDFCDPNPCADPVDQATWGQIKTIYR